MSGASHAGFILAAYLVTVAVMGGLVAAVLLDGRRLRRSLAEIEARGVRRRSAAPPALAPRDEVAS